MSTCTRVLLVDGRAERRGVVRMIVETGEHAGEVVAEASTAEEAVAKVDRLHIDAAVVEIQMPVTAGLEVIAALRADHPRLVIVVCSFHGDATTRAQAAAAGANAYLTKPVSGRQLQAALRSAVPWAAPELVAAG
ncbi:MAG TPA: response regulator [Acidimicrobiales bacterium]|nr:response regulator [Acidimicrobiales bacterium]